MGSNDPPGARPLGDERVYDQYIQTYRPMVYSVCRRYLRNPEDVEDAVQETFIKLARHLHQLHGSILAWLTSTAYSSSVDLIRRAASEQRRRKQLAQDHSAAEQNALVCEPVRQNIRRALLLLDEADRQLLIRRFFHRMPMRVIAREQDASVPTVSRKVVQAVQALGQIFRDLGFDSIDDLTLADQLGLSGDLAQRTDVSNDGLCFAPDWRTPALATPPFHKPELQIPYLPGWHRPVRLGVLVSVKSLQVTWDIPLMDQAEGQVWTTQAILHPGIQLVSIVEPASSSHGVIESTLRDFELTGGLIDGTDLEALRTLDVILLGNNYRMRNEVAAAFNTVVHEGVGLINEWWTNGLCDDDNDDVMDLMLAGSAIREYYTQPPGMALKVTVIEEHHLLPGIRKGYGCFPWGSGPIYRPRDDAKVIMANEPILQPEEHHVPGLGPARMPGYIVGHLGRGRVVVVNTPRHAHFIRALGLKVDYFFNLVSWLAEPRRLEESRLVISPATGPRGKTPLEF